MPKYYIFYIIYWTSVGDNVEVQQKSLDKFYIVGRTVYFISIQHSNNSQVFFINWTIITMWTLIKLRTSQRNSDTPVLVFKFIASGGRYLKPV